MCPSCTIRKGKTLLVKVRKQEPYTNVLILKNDLGYTDFHSGGYLLSELSRGKYVNHVYVDVGLKILSVCCLFLLLFSLHCQLDEVTKEV